MGELKEKILSRLNLKLISYIVGTIIALISIGALAWSIHIMVNYDSPEFQAEKNVEGSLASIPFRGFVIAFLFATFTLFVSFLMLRGIYVNRENYVMPFILWIGLLVAVALVRSLLGFITSAVHGEKFAAISITFLINFSEGLLGLLLFLPVYFYYNRMDAQPYYPVIVEKV